ncbi:hypothetical protein F5144DRAFT_625586 [Chaetomium tenue]|uniref:Uncharacterized protein n=1 Tax=Chaetomium tenue TaxID=1854479 RepID=A0ACB7PQK7_9PEZI|nr:hypothetical protein F5144DRAFT_625586 [Chaetomium globosum]
MAGLLIAFTFLGGWAVLLLAQSTPQNCIFSLVAEGNILGQVEGGQVVGIAKSEDSSAEPSGTIFRLRDGGLYDTDLRGCWWPEPSTVLVCSLQPPAYPATLFALDEYGHLVYNVSRRDFWACPTDLGSGGSDSNSSGSSGRYYYYLDLPQDMQRGSGVGGDGCRTSSSLGEGVTGTGAVTTSWDGVVETVTLTVPGTFETVTVTRGENS